jgi:hypothetical protein
MRAGRSAARRPFLADDQIYAVGEHHILALDQEKQKSGFGWFSGTQMTLAGDMAYMANGVKITRRGPHQACGGHAHPSRT